MVGFIHCWATIQLPYSNKRIEYRLRLQLDRRKLLHSADGTCRDWRGLAEKAGFTTNEIKDFEYREAVDVQILEYRYSAATA